MNNKVTLNDFLKQTSFVAFDTETTGLMALSHYIVEIAAVKFRLDSDEVEQFQQLVNPGVPMPEEVIRIHGITDTMVTEANSIKDVMPKFIDFCGHDSILIAHNAPFDISFIAQELRRSTQTFGASTVIDTVDIFRKYNPGHDSYSLLALSKIFGVADSQSHRALADAEMVHKLFQLIAPKLPADINRTNLSKYLSTYQVDAFLDQKIILPEQYEEISKAIEHGYRIDMIYAKQGASSHSRIVQPELLSKMNGVIYLSAFCELVNANRTFRIDRIESYSLIIDS